MIVRTQRHASPKQQYSTGFRRALADLSSGDAAVVVACVEAVRLARGKGVPARGLMTDAQRRAMLRRGGVSQRAGR